LTAVQPTPRSGSDIHRSAEFVPNTGDDKTGPDAGGIITPQAHAALLLWPKLCYHRGSEHTTEI